MTCLASRRQAVATAAVVIVVDDGRQAVAAAVAHRIAATAADSAVALGEVSEIEQLLLLQASHQATRLCQALSRWSLLAAYSSSAVNITLEQKMKGRKYCKNSDRITTAAVGAAILRW